jgi:hypothetical protein
MRLNKFTLSVYQSTIENLFSLLPININIRIGLSTLYWRNTLARMFFQTGIFRDFLSIDMKLTGEAVIERDCEGVGGRNVRVLSAVKAY